MSRSNPPEWEKFCELNQQYSDFSLYGMPNNVVVADANRFSARYRMIKDLDVIKVQGATKRTEDGYTALLKMLFVWGGAETVFKLSSININQQRQHFLSVYDTTKRNTLDSDLKSLRPEVDEFFKIIRDKSIGRHITEINNFLSDQVYDPSYLLSGIRHIFSHGTLSPNTGTKNPLITIKICNILTEFFTELIEQEFIKKVKSHPHY